MTIDLNGAFSTDPVANVATFMKAAKAGQTLTCSKPITVPVGAAAGAPSSGPLINISSTVPCDWQLDNLTLLTAPSQPTNAPSTSNQPACVLQFGNGHIGGNINIGVDGNGINQVSSNAENPYGYYSHGVRIFGPTGKFTGRIKVRNVRGVTSSSTVDANGVARAETFDFQILGGTGTMHNLDLDIASLDGSSPASGAVFQNMLAASQWFLKIKSQGGRHGMGCWGGGNGTILPGSYIVGAKTGINLEAGRTGTPRITVGGTSTAMDQILIVEGCNYGMVINGNLLAGQPVGTPQIDNVLIQNTWFVHNASDLNMTGTVGKRVDIKNVLYYDPTNTALRFMAGSLANNKAWAKTVFHQNSTYHFTKKQSLTIGAGLVTANGVPVAG